MEAILACTHGGGIGLNGKLPWRLKEDMKLFKRITTAIQNPSDKGKLNAVIMGRNTWESIPMKFRPLPNRINIILSRTMNKEETEVENSVYVSNSIEELDILISKLKKENRLATPFIIGGATLYNKMFELDKITKIHVSLVNDNYECDTFFPENHLNQPTQQQGGPGSYRSAWWFRGLDWLDRSRRQARGGNGFVSCEWQSCHLAERHQLQQRFRSGQFRVPDRSSDPVEFFVPDHRYRPERLIIRCPPGLQHR